MSTNYPEFISYPEFLREETAYLLIEIAEEAEKKSCKVLIDGVYNGWTFVERVADRLYDLRVILLRAAKYLEQPDSVRYKRTLRSIREIAIHGAREFPEVTGTMIKLLRQVKAAEEAIRYVRRIRSILFIDRYS